MATSHGRKWIVCALMAFSGAGVWAAGCSSSSSSPASGTDAGQVCPLTFDAANGAACSPSAANQPAFLCSFNYLCTGTLTENSRCVCNAATNKFDCFDSVNTNTPIPPGTEPTCVNDTSENPPSCPTKESDGTTCTTAGQTCYYIGQTCSDGTTALNHCQCLAVGNGGASGADAGFTYKCEDTLCGVPAPDSGTTTDSGTD